MAPMRTLFITLTLLGFGCGSSNNKAPDAAQHNDAPVDIPAVALDCNTYCSTIQTNCTGLNAQYGGANAADATTHCMATCAKFTAQGTVTDTTGTTLGCHLYHAGAPSMAMPGTHCIHAGPAGAQTDATSPQCGDACTNFCSLEIAVCGSTDAPISGVPAQYQNMAACLTACNGNPAASPPVPGFDKTHKYIIDGTMSPTVNPRGDSLACRLYHATNASISMTNAVTHCPHTAAAPVPGTPCNGAAAP